MCPKTIICGSRAEHYCESISPILATHEKILLIKLTLADQAGIVNKCFHELILVVESILNPF